MIASYWPVVLIVAGLLGALDQSKLAWIVLMIAGLLAVLPV